MPLWNVFESMAILYIMHGGRWVLPVGILLRAFEHQTMDAEHA